MAKKSKTRFVILGLLSEKPLAGYDIKKIIEIRFSFFWNESFGQIYPELEKLEKEGFVSKQTEKNGEKARNVYSITSRGMDELKSWLSKPVDTEITRYEILLKMYFGNLTDQENIIGYVEEFGRKHSINLKLMEVFENQLKGILDTDENHRHVLMTVLFGKKVLKAFVEWSEEVLPMLEETRKFQEKKG